MTAILTDLRGQRFGSLVVVKLLPRASSTSAAFWKCRCTCGGLAVVRAVQLLHGRKTCGVCRKSGGVMKRVRLHRERHPNPTLAERIALALGGNGTPIDAATLNSLFSEVADALLDAEQEVTVAQARVLDPTVLDDSAPEALRAAEHHRDRLAAALPALRTKHQQVVAQERQAAWHREADAIEARRDELTEVFASTYPELISQLIELFQRVKSMDAEVDKINGSAPNSESRRLLPVSIRPDLSVNTKLLGLSGQAVWPPPTPAILPEQVMPQLSHPGSHWFEAIQQRDQERQAEAQRVAEYHHRMAHDREQRDAAEARRGNGASP
jgi:hypothetical protein